MATPHDLIPVVQRSYDLCAGLYEHVNRFPRAQRGLLGRVILDDALRMLVSLTVANRRRDRTETLAEASGRLDALRITLRLSKHLGFLSNGGYARLTETADEVGRMLGGWLKYEADPSRPLGSSTMEGGAPSPPGDGRVGAGSDSASPSSVERSDRDGSVPPRRAGGVRYKMTSPTVEKYLRAKLEHPQAVVFVTVGAFCQTFFEDAAFCQRTLRLAVRNLAAASEPEKIPVCGIPRDKLERYVTQLRQTGRDVHVE